MSVVEEGVKRLMKRADLLGELREARVISEDVHKEMIQAALDDLFDPSDRKEDE